MIIGVKVKISIKRNYFYLCKYENKIYNRCMFWDWCIFFVVLDKRIFIDVFFV